MGPRPQRCSGSSRPTTVGRAFPAEGSALRHSRRRGDRKSTRLNSSHSQISYAVFCLKKKKLSSKSPRPSSDDVSTPKRFTITRQLPRDVGEGLFLEVRPRRPSTLLGAFE